MPKKGDTIDDRTLLQGVACRDRGAFEELVRRFKVGRMSIPFDCVQCGACRKQRRRNQRGIPGERREREVRRRPGAWRVERQHLPRTYACRSEEVDEPETIGAQIAGTVGAGQRCDMEQHAGGAGFEK